MTDEPEGAPRFSFVEAVDPLPLIDPTAAAQLLKVKRHTLACYRSLGDGPAYYKFGRWIRYGLPDLQQWASLSLEPDAIPSGDEAPGPTRTGTTILIDTPAAARFLTVTRHCLYNYRLVGEGPVIVQFGRRIYYSIDDLRRWADRQRCPRPSREIPGNMPGKRSPYIRAVTI